MESISELIDSVRRACERTHYDSPADASAHERELRRILRLDIPALLRWIPEPHALALAMAEKEARRSLRAASAAVKGTTPPREPVRPVAFAPPPPPPGARPVAAPTAPASPVVRLLPAAPPTEPAAGT